MNLNFYPRLGIFKNYNGNCTVNPATLESRSYGWWLVSKRFGSKLVFNSYRYSVTTAKHQSVIRRKLIELGNNPDLVIEAPGGLQDLASAVNHYNSAITILKAAIAKKGSRKAKNAERAAMIKTCVDTIKAIKKLQKYSD